MAGLPKSKMSKTLDWLAKGSLGDESRRLSDTKQNVESREFEAEQDQVNQELGQYGRVLSEFERALAPFTEGTPEQQVSNTLPAVVQAGFSPAAASILREGPIKALKRTMARKYDPTSRSQLNVFAGPKSQTADLDALKKAQGMDGRGMNKSKIREETGWFKDPEDGGWYYEIPDQDFAFTPRAQEALTGRGEMLTQKEAISHPLFEKAYPAARHSDVNLSYMPEHLWRGSFTPSSGQIDINSSAVNANPNNYSSLPSANSTGLHELQHWIDEFEGRQSGASSQMFKPQGGWDTRDMYDYTPGELRARNVQTRYEMGPDDLRMWDPADTIEQAPKDLRTSIAEQLHKLGRLGGT